VAGPRRRRPLASTWNYILNKTTHRARGHSRRSAAPTASRAIAGHVAMTASARAPNERRGAADAEAEGGASSSPRAGRRDSSARDALPQLRQRRTRARRSPKLAPRRARRSINTALKGSAQQHRNHCSAVDTRAAASSTSALVRCRTTIPPQRRPHVALRVPYGAVVTQKPTKFG
jgi:hypothetical protein